MAFKMPSRSSPKPVHRDNPYIFSNKTLVSSARFYIKQKMGQNRCLINAFSVISLENPEAYSIPQPQSSAERYQIEIKHQKES